MTLDVDLQDAHLEADIESAKLCSQPACRRVGGHCSSLLDALVIFKAWFIQRQAELGSTAGSSQQLSQRPRVNEVAAFSGTSKDSHAYIGNHNDSEVSSNILLQRDWALARAKRAEAQLNRLRSACLAMRVQIEAGLRYKAEVDQVKRELELTRDTVQHYKNIIEEGNNLREDLRTELVRVRKEASIARSQINSLSHHSFTAGGDLNSSTLRTRSHSRGKTYDRADTSATTMLTMSPKFEKDTEFGSVLHMRNQLERYIRWCDSLNEEVENLREAVRDSTEKELQQLQKLEVVRKKVTDLVEYVCTLEKRRSKRSSRLAKLALNYRWLGDVAQSIDITLPENFAALITADSKRNLEVLRAARTKKSHSSEQPADVSDVLNVDIDADLISSEYVLDDLDSGFTVQEKNPNKSEKASTPCSPLAPSVEYFFSDSESSLSDDAGSPAVATANFLTPPSGSPGSLSLPIAEGQSSPMCSKKSSAASTPDNVTTRDQTIGLFKTPLARPSRLKRNSTCEANKVAPSTADSVIHVPPAILPSPNEKCSSKRVNTESHTGQIELDVSPPQRMRTRSRSNSFSNSSPTPCSNSAPQKQLVTSAVSTLGLPNQDPQQSRSKRSQRKHSMTTASANDSATPVPTCSTGKPQHADPTVASVNQENVSQYLLTLLEPCYPKELIEWFDRISSTKSQPTDNQTPTNPVPTPSAKHSTHSQQEANMESWPCADNTTASPLAAAYTDFSLGSCTSPPKGLLSALTTSANDTVYQVCWVEFLNALRTSPTEAARKCMETKFVSVWRAIIKEKKQSDCLPKLGERLSSSLMNLVRDPDVLSSAVRAVFLLFSEVPNVTVQSSRLLFVQLVRSLFLNCSNGSQYGLTHLPVILDAAIQGFEHMWQSVEPLRDASDSQFHTSVTDLSVHSYWIATLQVLIAWQEAQYDHERLLGAPESLNRESLFIRLHARGWLSGSRSVHSVNSTDHATGRILSQHTHRIRCLALHLVDACLCVTRKQSMDTPVVLDPTRTNDDQKNEAACSLTVLLSAMGLIVGDQAILNHQDDTPSAPNPKSNPRGTTHQRKRRHRQTQRQQRYGLLGWLLTNRLLPWLSKCFKLLDEADASQTGNLIVDRLMVLIVDVIVLGSYLFHQSNNLSRTSNLDELRTVLHESGRRAIALINHRSASCHMSPEIRLVCLTRLFAFEPAQVLRSTLDIIDTPVDLAGLNMTSTILWPEVSLRALLNQALLLAERTIPHVPPALVQQYKDICNTRLAINPSN